MSDIEELAALRRLAELEDKAAGNVAPKKKEPEQSLLRDIALGGRAIGDSAASMLDLASAFGNPTALLNKLTGGPSLQDSLKRTFDTLGAYKPENKRERLLTDAVGGAYSSMAGGPTSLAKGALNAFAGGAGGLASGEARESGAGTLGQIGAGVGTAAGVSTLGALLGKLGGVGARVVDSAWLPGGDIRAAGRIANEAAGPAKQQVIDALRNGQPAIQGMPMNAGQLATPTGRAEFAGLQKVIDDLFPSPAKALSSTQDDAVQRVVDAIAQRGTNALKDTKAQLWNRLEPDLKMAYDQAGQYGKYAPQLQSDYQKFAEAAKGAVSDVRRLENAKQIAEDSASAFGRRQGNWNSQQPTGMPSAGGRNSYQSELANVAEKGSQKAADASLFFGDVARMNKNKLDALVAESYPLSGQSLAARMEQYLSKDGIAPLDIAKEIRSKFVSKLAEYSDANGNISPANLHAIRKEIGLDMAANVKNPAKAWDANLAAKFEGDLTGMIDAAMNKAAGTDKWSKWLGDYKEGMKAANDITIARELQKQSFKPGTGEFKPSAFLTATENATQSPDLLRKTGVARFGNIDEAMTQRGKDMKDAVSEHAKSLLQYEGLAQAGQNAARRNIGETFNPIPNAPFLSRASTVANALIRQLEGKGGKAATESLASMMQTDPKKLADVMEKLSPAEKIKMFEIMRQSAISQQQTLGERP